MPSPEPKKREEQETEAMTGILEVDQERQAATGNLEMGLKGEVTRAEKMRLSPEELGSHVSHRY